MPPDFSVSPVQLPAARPEPSVDICAAMFVVNIALASCRVKVCQKESMDLDLEPFFQAAFSLDSQPR